jgi:Pvc16 N-terminal domain
MITAVTQTLAEILAGEGSAIGLEQIDLDHPGYTHALRPRLNLYCYDLRQSVCMSKQKTDDVPKIPANPIWFDISFLITAWDYTVLGQQRLLSETLIQLLQYSHLPEDHLPPILKGYGALPLNISVNGNMDTAAFWRALGIPLRPALYITVTVPFPHKLKHSQSKKEMLLNY